MADHPSYILSGPLAFLAILSVLLLPHPAWAEPWVEAQLSAQEVGAGRPVELILTAHSTEGSVGAPEVSALEADFQVIDRRVERRTSVTNGRRREELRVRLILLPRRGGELEVPGVAFGGARTQPLRLRVAEGVQQAPGETLQAPASPLLDPGYFEPPGVSMPAPAILDPYADWPTGPLPGPAPRPTPLVYSPVEPPPQATAPKILPPHGPQPAAPTAPVEASEAEVGNRQNPWFWVSLCLAIVLIGVLGRRRRPAGAPHLGRSPGAVPEVLPPDPLETALETVRAAYQRGDGSGAREALLSWGRLRWPQDPPGNLARLARRCPPPLRDHITQLEKAFFSPDPVHWELDPVPEELAAQSPIRGRDAAAG